MSSFCGGRSVERYCVCVECSNLQCICRRNHGCSFLLYRGELFILLKKWIYTLINIMAPGAVRMARTEKTDVGKQVLPYGLAIGIGVMTAMIING